LYNVTDAIIDKLGDTYPNLVEKRQEIKDVILKEEKQF
jgi:alanyl-tRNA synthetase